MAKFIEFSSKSINPESDRVFDVSPEEVQAQMSNVKLIDVRRPDEYTGELGHIPGSELITLDLLPNNIDQIPKDQTVICICRSGKRSGRATDFLLEHGHPSVYNLKGGMIAWNENGFSTEGKNQE